MRKLFTFSVIGMSLFLGFTAHAQSTFADVRTVLQTNCNSNTCHGSGTANASFNVDTSLAVLYSQLVNGTPINPYAADTMGYKLVVPGDPIRSFLMRKIAHCTFGDLELVQPFEGAPMPEELPKISDTAIALIYQWIKQGADSVDIINPDTVPASVCSLVTVRTLPAHQVDFTVSPNPVSDAFFVSYTIKNSARVSIEVFDAKGVKTNVLSNRQRVSGTYRESFDANLPKGVYFIKLTIDGDQYLQKMVVL